jgi:hypothetical protein
MKEYLLIGLGLFCKGISIMSLRLTITMLKYLGIVVVVEEEEVYGDNL